MEFLIIGIVVAANIVFVFFKFDKKRTLEAFVDLALLIIVTIVFSGSYGALVVGTIASLLVSIYLYARPPDLGASNINIVIPPKEDLESFFEEFKSRTKRRYQ